MDKYITRNNAISAVCFGCNQQFSNEPCEPSECTIRQSIMALPTADVAPKSEVDKLEYTLMGVMHSVDKWLDGDELKQDEVNRAITMREKTLRIIENARSEVAREIFAEIDNITKEYVRGDIDGNTLIVRLFMLKKKHTEGKT